MRYLVVFFLYLYSSFLQANEKIDQAKNIVKEMCLSGGGYEIKADAKGNISIISLSGKGSINFSQNKLDGFVDVPEGQKKEAPRRC